MRSPLFEKRSFVDTRHLLPPAPLKYALELMYGICFKLSLSDGANRITWVKLPSSFFINVHVTMLPSCVNWATSDSGNPGIFSVLFGKIVDRTITDNFISRKGRLPIACKISPYFPSKDCCLCNWYLAYGRKQCDMKHHKMFQMPVDSVEFAHFSKRMPLVLCQAEWLNSGCLPPLVFFYTSTRSRNKRTLNVDL